MNTINKEFVLLLSIGIVIATPLSYYLMQALLNSVFEYHMKLGATPFIFAAALIVITAFTTLSSQIYKAATTNPVEILRSE